MTTGSTVTYGNIVAEIRPQKYETHRTRIALGGDLIRFPGGFMTPAADLTTSKILFNSVISTPDSKLIYADISNFYFNNPMDRYKYMKLPLYIILDKIIQQYRPQYLSQQGFILMEIKKLCMYCPNQSIFPMIY